MLKIANIGAETTPVAYSIKWPSRLSRVKDVFGGIIMKNQYLKICEMLEYKGLVNLFDIPKNKQFWAGAIFRQYEVSRLDAKKDEDNYYDLMLVDVSNYISDTFVLINVTLNSGNRGRIVAMIPNVTTTYFLNAKVIQDYFSPDAKIYFVEDLELLKK